MRRHRQVQQTLSLLTIRNVCNTKRMTSTSHQALSVTAPIPSIADALPDVKVPAWAWSLVALAVFVIYLVSTENGALLGSAANVLHEFMHDGRHVIAVPCH